MMRTAFCLPACVAIAVLNACSSTSPMVEAQSAYDSGDYDRAIDACTRSIDDGERGGYLLRGKSYEKKGEPLKAVADYDHARKEAPDQGEPAFREAKCYLQAGRANDAETTIAGAIRTRMAGYSVRDQMLAHAVHGEIQLAVGDLPKANECFSQALQVAHISKPLEAEGATAVVHYNLSRTNFELGAYRRARDSFQSYLAIQEGSGGVEEQDVYTLAVLHFLCEDIAAARKIASNLGPEARTRLDSILSGDTFSVGALYDLKQKQKDKDSRKDSE